MPDTLSAYELQRLATIKANNQYLNTLNLGPISKQLSDKTNKPNHRKPPRRKAKHKVKEVRRSSSGRSKELKARAAREQERLALEAE